MFADDSIKAFPKKEIMGLQKDRKSWPSPRRDRNIKGIPRGLFVVAPSASSLPSPEAPKI